MMNAEWKTIAVLVSVFVVSVLLVGTAFAMPHLEVSRSRNEVADAVRVAIRSPSDPLQYTFAADRSARLARESEIARLRGLAGPGAGSWEGVDEGVHLRGLGEAARRGAPEADCATLIPTRSWMTSAARLTGLAERYLGEEIERGDVVRTSRAHLAYAARLTRHAVHLDAAMDDASPALSCLVSR